MNLSQQIAKQIRAVYFGGNWTSVNVKDTLQDISWQEATSKVNNFNTILALVYHTSYYIGAIRGVLAGGPLDARDIYSFDHPAVNSAEDWDQLTRKTLEDAEAFAATVETLPEEKLWETFVDEKYGNYYRNIHGIIEHTHYHLGQMVLIKKLLAFQPDSDRELSVGAIGLADG